MKAPSSQELGPPANPGRFSVVHVEDLIEAGAEQILFSSFPPFAWFAHGMALRFIAINAVNHVSPGRETTN